LSLQDGTDSLSRNSQVNAILRCIRINRAQISKTVLYKSNKSYLCGNLNLLPVLCISYLNIFVTTSFIGTCNLLRLIFSTQTRQINVGVENLSLFVKTSSWRSKKWWE